LNQFEEAVGNNDCASYTPEVDNWKGVLVKKYPDLVNKVDKWLQDGEKMKHDEYWIKKSVREAYRV
jgi:hypothetical protein